MDALTQALAVVHAQQQQAASESDASNTLVVSADLGERPQVSRHLFGLFLEHLGRCIYDGVADPSGCVREDVVQALLELRVPNLRWPGGCFADGYHWRDGIGPPEQRTRTVNQHWGGGVESNRFGSHEFMALCEAVKAEPYIVGNVGSGGVRETCYLTTYFTTYHLLTYLLLLLLQVREMADWLEYLTYAGESSLAAERAANGRGAPWKLRFWAVGNESWGCGGDMSAARYAEEFRRFGCFLRLHGETPLCKIACGADDDDYAWTATMMQQARKGRRWLLQMLSLHVYCAMKVEGVTASADGEAAWAVVLGKVSARPRGGAGGGGCNPTRSRLPPHVPGLQPFAIEGPVSRVLCASVQSSCRT